MSSPAVFGPVLLRAQPHLADHREGVVLDRSDAAPPGQTATLAAGRDHRVVDRTHRSEVERDLLRVGEVLEIEAEEKQSGAAGLVAVELRTVAAAYGDGRRNRSEFGHRDRDLFAGSGRDDPLGRHRGAQGGFGRSGQSGEEDACRGRSFRPVGEAPGGGRFGRGGHRAPRSRGEAGFVVGRFEPQGATQ